MLSHKYIKDYSLDGDNYIGDTYMLPSKPGVRTKRLIVLFTVSIAMTAAFIGCFGFDNGFSHILFVAVPMAFNALTIYNVWCGLINYLMLKDPITRMMKDKSEGKLKAAATGGIVITALTAVGIIVSFAFGFANADFGNLVFAGCVLLNLVCFALTYKVAAGIEFIKTDNDNNGIARETL